MSWDFVQLLEAQVIPITVGSDWGSRSDLSLLPNVHQVVRRVGDEQNKGRKNTATFNKIPLEVNLILEKLTKNGAAAVGLSKVTGSIEAGKRANFIMLNRNTVEELGDEVMAEFKNVKVLKTWFGCESVWNAESGIIKLHVHQA